MKTIHIKKNIAIALQGALLFACLQKAQALVGLPWHEPFPLTYTNNENGASVEAAVAYPTGGPSYSAVRIGTGNSLITWSQGGGSGTGSPVIIGGAGLSYTGLGDPSAPSSAGVYFRTLNTTGGRSRGAVWTGITNGTVYASFLMKLETAPTLDRRLFVMLTDGVAAQPTGGPLGVWIETNGCLSVSKSVNSPNTPAAQPAMVATNTTPLSAGTHLIVVRYTFNPGTDDDDVSLWIDPSGAQLGVSEGSVPAATLSGTGNGSVATDATSIASFYEFHPSTEIPASFALDEIRVGTTWAHVTPSGAVCNSATISIPPANQTVSEGVAAVFSAVVSGTSPTYQWQVSNNNGATWNNVSTGIGGNSPVYQTPPTGLTDNNNKYRIIATTPCSGISATSSVATVTVTPAVVTPNGVVLDDVFDDLQYNNLPYGISNSVWLQSTASTLDASSGDLVGTSQANSVNWVGYFTDDQSGTNLPVHLAVGKALKVTLIYKGTGIIASGGNFRIGLFDYVDGGTRPVVDGSGVANSGLNVKGYMCALNYGTNFSGNPFSLYARNTLVADLMGTTGNFEGLGGGPGNMTGLEAFLEGVYYTNIFTITRKGVSTVDFTVKADSSFSSTSPWVHTRTDTNYAYCRFDAIAIRSASAALAANNFTFSRLLVEVVDTAPSPGPLNIASSGSNVTLTWTNSAFSLQAAPNATGTYTNVPGATSPYVTPAGGSAKFFRLIWP